MGRRLGASLDRALSKASTGRIGAQGHKMSDRPLVVYYRVSTRQQKRSSLGLLAQQDSAHRYIAANPGRLIAEVTEIESGRSGDRPELKEALRLCRVYNARLIIARLDRLARSVVMIAQLLESDVDFVAADMPLANRFTIHILAAVAEYEARLISDRTKAAFAAAKARGRTFGNPRPETHRFSDVARKARVKAERERSKRRALDFAPLLCALRDQGQTINEIAQHLTALGVVRPRGGHAWGHSTVRRMFEHACERKPKSRFGRRPQAMHPSAILAM
jgi:DNA invertase Pin-like site-specific DNA recombinase